jgi:hypothetical protein
LAQTKTVTAAGIPPRPSVVAEEIHVELGLGMLAHGILDVEGRSNI